MVQLPFPLATLPLFALYLLGLLALSYAISADARARGVRFPTVLGVAAAVFGLVALIYLIFRDNFGPRAYRASKWERIAWTYFGAMMVAMMLGAILSPPDPFTQARQFPIFLVATLPFAYLVVFKNPWSRLKAAVR
ncbi:hypothetical protein SAMN04487950_2407 [Halogranum rubrum]|uniref:Uncharacterized protein n=1 Tax=Halogranum rubrum TaxID=553466 RepID=A0A1I4EUF6_9EURY|nr:hypothetical protein [Halogranum rubrum]SFL09314.1 hypothetical protein SAMN04487950_2407 [Halogranum rubrum]